MILCRQLSVRFILLFVYSSVQLPYHGMMAFSVGTQKEQLASALKRGRKRLDLAVEAHGR